MRRLSKWVLACGSAAAIVGINPVQAGPFDIFRGQSATLGAEATNAQVANNVAAALKSANLSGKNIQIEVQNGTAVLKGDIADSRQKAIATQVVASVDGVKSVDNQMKPMVATPAVPSGIRQAAFNGPKGGQIQQVSGEQAPAKVSNQDIATAIARELAQNGLSKYEIQVRYKGGAASLIGDVGHPMEALKAQEIAYAHPHVNHVVNELTAGGLTAKQILAQMEQAHQQAAPQQPIRPAGFVPPMPQGAPQGAPVQPAGFHGRHHGPMGAPVGGQPMYNGPNLPNHAWPSYAPYDNYSAVTYPSQYDASAWPYIGPFYPYPQVPMGWRSAQLVWDDGSWNLKFNPRTDRWWWFLNPHNWD